MTPSELAAIHARSFTMPRPWSEAEFADLLASPHVFLDVTPQGFVLGRVIADEAELLTIAVDPVARRQGQARRLLARFAELARARGAAGAFLEVAETNMPARAAYTAAGWRESGRRKGYYRSQDGGRIDALILTLPLDSTSA